MATRQFRVNNLEIKAGNFKLGIDTLIYSLGSAMDCISEKLGLCLLPKFCYAKQSEIQYPNVAPYRERQKLYFDNTLLADIKKDFCALLAKNSKVIKGIKYLRVNESGDFSGQKQLNKFVRLSKFLYDKFKIITYTYTCRSDLNFPDLKYFLVKGSSCVMPNGTTEVFESKAIVPKSFTICPTTCLQCKLCKKPNKKDIAFVVHGAKGTISKFKADSILKGKGESC